MKKHLSNTGFIRNLLIALFMLAGLSTYAADDHKGHEEHKDDKDHHQDHQDHQDHQEVKATADKEHKDHDNHKEHKGKEADKDHEHKEHKEQKGHSGHAGHGDHHDDEVEEPAKGPHNGRLLKDGDFTLELAIFEKGVPPEYRVWASENDKPIAPKDWQLNVELTRLGGRVDKFKFAADEGFLRSQSEVQEPHSFEVSVTATYKNQTHHWQFPSYEDRLSMSAALAQASGVTTTVAGAGTLQQRLKLYGQVLPDPVRVSHIQARYPGVIRSVLATIGSQVKAGDVLATVESNESLRQYSITAPISGTIIARHANSSEFTGDKTLFTLVDYAQLEVDIQAFPAQARQLKVGQSIAIKAGELSATSKIEYLTPNGEGGATLVAHAALDNRLGQWTPNQMLEVAVTIGQIPVPLMINNRALQTFRDWQVVFIQVGDTFEIRPLQLGQTDGEFTEVLGGLNVGDRYVVENSFLLKSDLEKSGASHDH